MLFGNQNLNILLFLTDWGAGQSCLCNAWPGMKQNHQICSIMLRTIVTVVDHTGSVGVWIEIDTA